MHRLRTLPRCGAHGRESRRRPPEASLRWPHDRPEVLNSHRKILKKHRKFMKILNFHQKIMKIMNYHRLRTFPRCGAHGRESRRRPPEASLRWPHERRIVRCPGPPAASGAERSSRSTSHWRSSTSFLVCSAAEIRSRSSQVNRLGRLLLRGGIEVKTKKAAL